MIHLLLSLATSAAFGAPTGFHFKNVDDGALGLWQDARPVFVYNFGERSLPDVRAAGVRSSYFHPIYGLDGEVLTDDFPSDHYHHHGLFWGWPHVRVAERDYDLWKMRGIRIVFIRWISKKADHRSATLEFENAWMVSDRPIVRERVTVRVNPATNESRSIDFEFEWTALEKAVTLGGAEGKSYGGVSLRFAKRKETTITVPAGRTTEDLLMTPLPWADLSGHFSGANKPTGISLFVHESHPGFPTEWMTREYGLLAVGWPGVVAKTLQPGESVNCRYRLWIHRGSPNASQIQAAYSDYVHDAVCK